MTVVNAPLHIHNHAAEQNGWISQTTICMTEIG